MKCRWRKRKPKIIRHGRRRLHNFLDAASIQKKLIKSVKIRNLHLIIFNCKIIFKIVPQFSFQFISIHYNFDKQAELGNDVVLFFAISISPSLFFNYASWFRSIPLFIDNSALVFPNVQKLDVLYGRAIMEIAAKMLSCIGIFFVLLMIGPNPTSFVPMQALLILFFIILLFVEVGIIVSLTANRLNFVTTNLLLFLILVCLLLSTFCMPAYLPQQIGYWLSWNQVKHGAEWMRIVFDDGYPDQFLSKQFFASLAFMSLFAGSYFAKVARINLPNFQQIFRNGQFYCHKFTEST